MLGVGRGAIAAAEATGRSESDVPGPRQPCQTKKTISDVSRHNKGWRVEREKQTLKTDGKCLIRVGPALSHRGSGGSNRREAKIAVFLLSVVENPV